MSINLQYQYRKMRTVNCTRSICTVNKLKYIIRKAYRKYRRSVSLVTLNVSPVVTYDHGPCALMDQHEHVNDGFNNVISVRRDFVFDL